jgi:hypothetical protein
MTLRLAHIGLAAAAIVFVATQLTSHAARAFTINTESAADAYGNSRFADPDEQVQNFGRGGSLFGQGGPSVQFGAPGPFDRAPGGGNWFSQPFGPR